MGRFALQSGIDDLDTLRDELDGYRDVLLGREPFPIDSGLMTLMEVASAYYARAKEMEQLIHRAENKGLVTRGSDVYKFRTGELRSFLDLAKDKVELGSRRVTAAKIEVEMDPGMSA